MFYILLLVVVITVLQLVSWRFPSRRHAFAYAKATPQSAAGPEPGSPAEVFSRLVKGQRKVDEACLTPIDCVLDDHCDGHCGCR